MNTNLFKGIAIAATAFVLFVSNPLASRANEGVPVKAGLTEKQVNVTYLGTKEDNVVFRVEFENPTAEKFSLLIKNDAGDVVYRKQFSDTHFAKVVYFPKDDQDTHPTFVIRDSNNNDIVRQFAVNTTVIESIVVTRL